MAIRVTQTPVEIAVDRDASVRVTQTPIEVAVSRDHAICTTQVVIEVAVQEPLRVNLSESISAQDIAGSVFQLSQFYIDVLVRHNNPEAQFSQVYIDVLVRNNLNVAKFEAISVKEAFNRIEANVAEIIAVSDVVTAVMPLPNGIDVTPEHISVTDAIGAVDLQPTRDRVNSFYTAALVALDTAKERVNAFAVSALLQKDTPATRINAFYVQVLVAEPLRMDELEYVTVEDVVTAQLIQTVVVPAPQPIGENPVIWAEWFDPSNTVWLFANNRLPDPLTYYYGPKPPTLTGTSLFSRSMCDVITGEWDQSTFSYSIMDYNYVMRGILATTLRHVDRTLTAVRIISDAGRRIFGIPWTLGVGRLKGVNFDESSLEMTLNFSDVISEVFFDTYKARTHPVRKITSADFSSCPTATLGLSVPIIYGRVSDELRTDAKYGAVKCIYVGTEIIGGRTYYRLLIAGHACKSIRGWYYDKNDGSVPTHNAGAGSSFFIPGYTGFSSLMGTSASYRDINGNRYTLAYATGTDGQLLATGDASLRVQVDGVEDIGDGTGTLITNFYDQYAHWLENYVVLNNNYVSGRYLKDVEYPNYIFMTDTKIRVLDRTTFDRCKTITALRYPPNGYSNGGLVFGGNGEEVTFLDAMRIWNTVGDCRLYINKLWQVCCWTFNQTLALETLPDVTDQYDIIKESFVPEISFEEKTEKVRYLFGKYYATTTHDLDSLWAGDVILNASAETIPGALFVSSLQRSLGVEGSSGITGLSGTASAGGSGTQFGGTSAGTAGAHAFPIPIKYVVAPVNSSGYVYGRPAETSVNVSGTTQKVVLSWNAYGGASKIRMWRQETLKAGYGYYTTEKITDLDGSATGYVDMRPGTNSEFKSFQENWNYYYVSCKKGTAEYSPVKTSSALVLSWPNTKTTATVNLTWSLPSTPCDNIIVRRWNNIGGYTRQWTLAGNATSLSDTLYSTSSVTPFGNASGGGSGVDPITYEGPTIEIPAWFTNDIPFNVGSFYLSRVYDPPMMAVYDADLSFFEAFDVGQEVTITHWRGVDSGGFNKEPFVITKMVLNPWNLRVQVYLWSLAATWSLVKGIVNGRPSDDVTVEDVAMVALV